MHLVKLGVARHLIASCVVALGDWDIFTGSAASIAALLELSHNDFVWCCKHEIKANAASEVIFQGRFPLAPPDKLPFWRSLAQCL